MYSDRQPAKAGSKALGTGDQGNPSQWQDTISMINNCPYYRLLGMEVEAMGGGWARLRLPIDQNMHWQIYHTAHGGVIASLVDSAIAVALISTASDDEQAVTIEMNVNFVAPAREGLLTAEGRLFQRGKVIVAGEAEVRDERGGLVAKGTATCIPYRPRGRRQAQGHAGQE